MFLSYSCNDDDEDVTYLKEDLIGLWEQVTPTPDSEGHCSENYRVLFEFTDSDLKSITQCADNETSATIGYEFDGKTITFVVFGIETVYTITELSATTLTANTTTLGMDGGVYSYTKVTE